MNTPDFTNGDLLENVTSSAVRTMTFSSVIDLTSIGKKTFLELTTPSNISGLVTSLWTNTTNDAFNSSVSTAPSIDCTPAGYHEFPPDAFSNEQRGHGALVLHMCFVIYMFVALAIVCDEYFVSSLDKMCEKLGVSEDVAGATFMAAGSSAPELFTSMIGVFVTKGDVGIGTIVGSAVFNILFVIGLCGLLAGKVVPLAWWPLCRDSLFYSLSIIILILVVYDGVVTWYESLIMLLFYALYIVIMRYNRKIQSWVVEKIKKVHQGDLIEINGSALHQVGNRFHGDYEAFNNDEDDVFSDVPAPRSSPFITLFDYVNNVKIKVSMQEACLLFMMRPPFRITTRFRAAVRLAISYRQRMRRDTTYLRRQMFKGTAQKSSVVSYTKSVRNWFSRTYEGENYESWMEIPDKTDGYINLFKWVTTYPIRGLLYLTVPDSRKKRWENWYMATFGMSIIWIAAFSYIMVWMVTLIGFTLRIPDSVMGITFLAAGTSIPDAMASVFVARQGMGDMAVSNSIGSNVFDILLGLSLPWFLKTGIVSAGTTVRINSNGMIYSIVLLFLTVIIAVLAIRMAGWVLNKFVGVICLSVYAIYVLFSVMIECNVFGFVNLPMCTD